MNNPLVEEEQEPIAERGFTDKEPKDVEFPVVTYSIPVFVLIPPKTPLVEEAHPAKLVALVISPKSVAFPVVSIVTYCILVPSPVPPAIIALVELEQPALE